MKNYYSTVAGVVTTFSNIKTNWVYETIDVRFEKGSAFAEYELPSRRLKTCSGFNEDELFDLADYLLCNESIIWELSLSRCKL